MEEEARRRPRPRVGNGPIRVRGRVWRRPRVQPRFLEFRRSISPRARPISLAEVIWNRVTWQRRCAKCANNICCSARYGRLPHAQIRFLDIRQTLHGGSIPHASPFISLSLRSQCHTQGRVQRGGARSAPTTTPTRGKRTHSQPRSSLATPSCAKSIFGVSPIDTPRLGLIYLAAGTAKRVTWLRRCAQRADDICRSARCAYPRA